MADDVFGIDTPEAREREYARRSALQEEILHHAYRRRLHRAYVETALRRTGHQELSGPPSDLSDVRRRAED